MAGRIAKVNCETYLDAVRAKKSLDDKDIADYLGVNRSNVYRFRTNEDNAECIAQAEAIISDIDTLSFEKQISKDVFENIPEIKEWKRQMIANENSEGIIQARINGIYNLCCHLKTHPARLDVDRVANFVVDMKVAYIAGEPQIRGLYYTSIRDPVRSYFALVKGVSGEYLKARGVDMGETKGAGQFAHISVTRVQRKRLEENLRHVINEYSNSVVQENKADLYLEILNFAKFMYYTGSRKTASIETRFNNPKNVIRSDYWGIHIVDKGKKGGYEWVKLLQHHALDDFKNYVYLRFGIPETEQNSVIAELDSYVFPLIVEIGDRIETAIMKTALESSGNKQGFPNHIWRHTFAQEFLKATDYNYELCASVGGWKSTKILKKHYGEMSEDARIHGLSVAMGVEAPVKEEVAVLRW